MKCVDVWLVIFWFCCKYFGCMIIKLFIKFIVNDEYNSDIRV